MLLTSGCSFVWGDELEGFDNNPPTHEHLTFTHLLAKKMGMPYVNQGLCGSCNERIFRDLITYLSDPTKTKPTHMVVMWSAWQRDEIAEPMTESREEQLNLYRPNGFTQYSPERTQNLSNYDRDTRLRRDLLKRYYETCYDSRTVLMEGITRMKTIQLLADSLGIKLIQGTFHNRAWNNILATLNTKDIPQYNKLLVDSISSLHKTSRVGMGRYKDLYTLAEELDDVKPFGHPGERTQVVFADMLKTIFVEEF